MQTSCLMLNCHDQITFNKNKYHPSKLVLSTKRPFYSVIIKYCTKNYRITTIYTHKGAHYSHLPDRSGNYDNNHLSAEQHYLKGWEGPVGREGLGGWQNTFPTGHHPMINLRGSEVKRWRSVSVKCTEPASLLCPRRPLIRQGSSSSAYPAWTGSAVSTFSPHPCRVAFVGQVHQNFSACISGAACFWSLFPFLFLRFLVLHCPVEVERKPFFALCSACGRDDLGQFPWGRLHGTDPWGGKAWGRLWQ